MHETVAYFKPEEASKFPYTTMVESLLGGVGRAIYPDGTLQFRDDDDHPALIFSPQLPPIELEEFCRENIERYEAFYDDNADQLEKGERIHIDAFWI